MKFRSVAALWVAALTLILAIPSWGRQNYSAESALIPMPARVETGRGDAASLADGYKIVSSLPHDSFEISELRNVLKSRLDALESPSGLPITVTVSDNLPVEGYELKVSDSGISLTGGSEAGILYGVMTLDQILIGDVPSTAAMKIAQVTVNDAPRYPMRALMLDPARHFLPVADVKRYIDEMARYKYNTLQLHLTDDEGWRIEIPGHPELTEGMDHYSDADIRDLVHYAAERHIEIVPELDIPGHTAALLAAHPEMRCATGDTAAIRVGKSHNLMLCASVPEVYSLLHDVIGHVAELFPAKSIHLGGDESVLDRNWGECIRCRKLMADNDISSTAELMGYFFDRVLPMVREAGKEPVLWCELDNIRMPASKYLFPYPQDVTLVTWRMGLSPLCFDLTNRSGHKLIMAPGEHAYLDYPQMRGDLPEFNNWGMPVTTLARSYEMDPACGRLGDDAHVEGVMATLWGEAIGNIDRAFYMTYPRALAIAEAGWTPAERRDAAGFTERMWPVVADMMRRGVPVRAPYEAAR